MKTAQDLHDWIDENADKGRAAEAANVDTSTRREGTTEEKARWFCAYQAASDNHACCTIKDWAHMFLNGIKPIDVQTWLDEKHEIAEPDEDMDADIVEALREHFGIK